MTERYQRETARIYSLADRVRFGAARPAKPAAAGKNPAAAVVPADFGGAWYHDEAIRDTDPSRKS